ncbi:MAG: hypothetical protein EP330_07035 [Deltaproteobacteria bacterium]|nr:MAG: hypothetical protein EP330_07035 [Deltaproteobacteria bacterium]
MLPLLPLLLGCAPRHLVIPEPEYVVATPRGEAVAVSYPVDVRPTEERRDGGWYTTSLPLPFATHGDANLTPTSLGAIARASHGALAERGIPEDPESDTRVSLYVLHHAGTRDVSDAQWTSTLTGGVAGYVGKFVYPVFFVGYGAVRVEVETPEYRVVRDVSAYSVRRMSVVKSWAWPHLFRKSPSKEAMTEVLAEVHTELGREIAAVVDQARTGHEITAGEPAVEPSAHSLGTWSQADSFRRHDLPPWVAAKYPSERFSLMTGHDTVKGEVVGRIAFPLDTVGYDVGLTDRLQWQLDITVLGVVNQARTGLRYRLFRYGDLAFAAQLSTKADVTLLPSEGYVPSVVAISARGSGILSWRPSEITWYARGGWSAVHVRREIAELPDLRAGRAVAISGASGFELQLSATTLLAFELRASSTYQNGNPLALGDLGTFQVVPLLALGLR